MSSTSDGDGGGAPVEVRLLDKAYLVACAEDERAGLVEAARLLDERLRSMKQVSKGATLERVAVLAALNLAHERLQAERALADQHSQTERLLQDLDRQLQRLSPLAG
ncbi:cell division protein ZapA [Pseudomarimonas arenosa]|uniref:Cell division protein ZapA n=1 Tax=Pseudomarimonas arenosa TaxID=2774145 RepID=A0AAW3ZMY6_9GAMM|nr:cell division protein ZapA [Pseudomarimonas arenosa]MBD8527490.1 cell division protein ZapA [Pseudomarimonas arenosa]